MRLLIGPRILQSSLLKTRRISPSQVCAIDPGGRLDFEDDAERGIIEAQGSLRNEQATTMGVFTDKEVWNGGFYELAVEYGQGGSSSLARGLERLWVCDELEGCYLDRHRDPREQPRLPFQPTLVSAGHLLGVAQLTDTARVPCGTCTISEAGGSDWLVFYVPMGALARVYSVGAFPFDVAVHESWRVPLEGWLASIGRKLFREAPFKLGLVGFEASGELSASELLASGIPEQRQIGLLVPDGDGLGWFPRNST